MSFEITLIIADDHPLVRRGLQDLIEGAERLNLLAQVGTGPEAWRAIQERKPTVAVLDFEMPGLTGLEVAQQARDAGSHTAVILLTMHQDSGLLDAAIAAGVCGYVLKENTEVELLDCIRAVAAGKKFFSPSLSDLLVNRSERAAQLYKKQPGLSKLTRAEIRILRLISENKSSKEIADQLRLSSRTVDNHRYHISDKLGLRGTHSLVKFAYENKNNLTEMT